MEAVVLSPLVLVGAAPALVVAVVLLLVAGVVPPGGLAVELHPASTNAAAAGATASAASLDEWSVTKARIDPRFPVAQPGTCWSRLVMPSSRPRSQRIGAPPW